MKQKYYENNKEFVKEKSKKYAQKNNIKLNLRVAQRRKTDIAFRLRRSISSTVRRVLHQFGKSKALKSILQYLPYTLEDLKQHLENKFEPWMTWENQGNYRLKYWDDNDQSTWRWHIDHIIPQAALPYTSMEDDNFKKCWALENLRPLSAKENILKGKNFVDKIIDDKHT